MRSLVSRHIEDAVTKEWPQLAERGATLSAAPQPLADLQALALGLRPDSPGQTIAQQEIVRSVELRWMARRQRIIVSSHPSMGPSGEAWSPWRSSPCSRSRSYTVATDAERRSRWRSSPRRRRR